MAQLALVWHLPGVNRALEVGKIFLRNGCCFRFIGHKDVNHTVRHLKAERSDLLRRI